MHHRWVSVKDLTIGSEEFETTLSEIEPKLEEGTARYSYHNESPNC